MKITLPAELEGQAIRRVYDEATKIGWFSVVDVMPVLTQQADFQTGRKYWNQLKRRLEKEGSESVTSCQRLKLQAADGKNYLSDVATAQTLLRLVHPVPSPKRARLQLEGQTGKPVVSDHNDLAPPGRKALKAPRKP